MLARMQGTWYCALQHSWDKHMNSQDLPQDSAPLSPLEYWRESVSAWSDFSQRAAQIMISQLGQSATKTGQNIDPETDTLASELLRSFSDLNLRHWQNTARLLESVPTWTDLPNTMSSSTLVDWYDGFQRANDQASGKPAAATKTKAKRKKAKSTKRSG